MLKAVCQLNEPNENGSLASRPPPPSSSPFPLFLLPPLTHTHKSLLCLANPRPAAHTLSVRHSESSSSECVWKCRKWGVCAYVFVCVCVCVCPVQRATYRLSIISCRQLAAAQTQNSAHKKKGTRVEEGKIVLFCLWGWFYPLTNTLV